MHHPKPHDSPLAFIIILFCFYLLLVLFLGGSNSMIWKQQTVFHSTHWKLLDLKFNVWNCVTKKTENWLTCTRGINGKASGLLRWLRRTWTGVNMSLGWQEIYVNTHEKCRGSCWTRVQILFEPEHLNLWVRYGQPCMCKTEMGNAQVKLAWTWIKQLMFVMSDGNKLTKPVVMISLLLFPFAATFPMSYNV